MNCGSSGEADGMDCGHAGETGGVDCARQERLASETVAYHAVWAVALLAGWTVAVQENHLI